MVEQHAKMQKHINKKSSAVWGSMKKARPKYKQSRKDAIKPSSYRVYGPTARSIIPKARGTSGRKGGNKR